MNQKIKELIEQAKFREEYYPGGSTVEYRTYINQEKFAELIVRECVEYYLSQIGKTSEPHTRTLEHFGIE